MLNDTPWSGLGIGREDTRRVSAAARWNWFWAMMLQDDAALVLQLTDLPKPAPDLPKLRSLEIGFRTLPAGHVLCIRLKDRALREPFETLCRDVVTAGERARTEAEAVERAISRTMHWHHLLRGDKPGILSEEAQKGLIGEIEVLKLLMATLGARTALSAWTGPSGAPKDFELPDDCIEVKARRSASQPYVRISNEHQLAPVPGRRLWLAVLNVDKVPDPGGQTLSDWIADITACLQRDAPSAIMDWEQHLADAGFDHLHDYGPWRWIASAPDTHAVTDAFPRIVAPVPPGVSNVSYALDLAACAPFRTNWSVLHDRLSREMRA